MRAIDARLKKIKETQARIRIREGLPHLYGWKWYKWAREFFESRNRFCLLTAANQCSKSSTQIRKVIHWATEPKLWPALWSTKPQQFWYMYPSSDIATSEYHTKWQQFLPRNEFKDHPQYGWRADIQQRQIKAIYFNTGLRLYFKNYSQKDKNLQGSSVHYIGCDEEVLENLYNELRSRLIATRGYFSSVFTATIGQDFWRLAMDPGEGEREVLPEALKLTVSLYDCLQYEDGTPSHWTLEEIKRIEESCSTHNEVLKRVHGKFIKDIGGRKYPTFDIKKHHIRPDGPVPMDWNIYSAVDLGSGGPEGHPAAIVFIAVNQELTRGRVFKCWRGDGIITSDGDVYNKYCEMRSEIGRPITAQYYDFGSKDFEIIATRVGDPFIKADKSHERGEQVLNTVFKFGMLTVDMLDGDEGHELRKLSLELSTIPKSGKKKNLYDDLADSCRYCSVSIPWDFTRIIQNPLGDQVNVEEKTGKAAEDERFKGQIVIRQEFDENDFELGIETEFAELNELYGN
jgi:hypothetical protein